jgi:hypothetical protein
MKRRTFFSLFTATVLVLFPFISGAVGQVIYDSIPTPLPGNVTSLGFSCCGLNEVGDQVQFAGTNRTLSFVTVIMSDWACESGDWTGATGACITTSGATFSHPITLNIYDNSLNLLATKTQDFDIPYRPSQNPANCGPETHTWYDPSADTCYNGLAFRITFDFSSLNPVLPDEVIFGVTYNTSNQGYNPIGTPGPYDSLNVALRDYAVFGPPLSKGTDVNPDAIFLSCTNGVECADVSAVLHEETGWAYTPAVSFTTVLPVPMTKNDCKKGGWKNLFRADGTPFKNQGKCIQYVNTGKGSPTKDDCKKGGWKSLFRADGSPIKNQGDCIEYFNTGK